MSFQSKLIAWLSACPELDGFIQQAGELRETGADDDDSFVCFYRDGGRQTGPVNSFPRVKIWLYGNRDSETIDGHLDYLADTVDSLFNYATEPMQVCGFISARVLGGIIGPKFTDNGRATYGMTVEFID